MTAEFNAETEQTLRAEESGGHSLVFDLEHGGGYAGSSVEPCSTWLLGP